MVPPLSDASTVADLDTQRAPLPNRRRASQRRDRGTARSPGSLAVADEVLEQFRAGDEAAFDIVFRAYYPKLCQFVVQTFGVDREDAEDVGQTAFIKVWRTLKRLPREVSIAACLFQVTRTEALNLLQSRGRRARLDDARSASWTTPATTQTDDLVHRRLLLETVRRAIASFPRRCRDAFWLRRVGGLSYDEVGQALGMQPRTAETHVREGHRRLLEHLGIADL